MNSKNCARMPLYEFLRLAIEKLESSQHKPCSIDPSLETENDLVGGETKNDKITIDRASRSPNAPSAYSDSKLGNSVTERTEKCVGVEPKTPSLYDKILWDGDRFSSFKNGSSSDQIVSDLFNSHGAMPPSFRAHSQHEKDNDKGNCQDGIFGKNGEGLYVPVSQTAEPNEVAKNIGPDTFLNRDRRSIRAASSSASSRNSADDRASCEEKRTKRRFDDNEESECQSDELQNAAAGAKNPSQDGGDRGSKRRRAAEVHNLSERRRRDRINQKLQTLQELIPNCNKADKASMLDEVIEYLKNLKHQVQILSMGSGLPLMLGAQQMYHAPIPHFSYMGVRMGSCTSFGYINGRCPVSPSVGPFLPICGHPGPVPLTGWPTKLNHEDIIMNKNSHSMEASRSSQLQSTTDVANQNRLVKGKNRTAAAVRTARSSR